MIPFHSISLSLSCSLLLSLSLSFSIPHSSKNRKDKSNSKYNMNILYTSNIFTCLKNVQMLKFPNHISKPITSFSNIHMFQKMFIKHIISRSVTRDPALLLISLVFCTSSGSSRVSSHLKKASAFLWHLDLHLRFVEFGPSLFFSPLFAARRVF